MNRSSTKWLYSWGLVLLGASQAWAAEEGAHEAPLGPTLWAIGSFVVVLAVLYYKLLPPILKAMDKRADDIRESLDAAERAKTEAQEMIQRHEDSLAKARAEAAAIIEEGRSDAQKLKNSIVEKAGQESAELAARAKRDIEQTKQIAVSELQDLSAQLGVDIANALIRKNLTVDDQKDLIEDRIRNFPAA